MSTGDFPRLGFGGGELKAGLRRNSGSEAIGQVEVEIHQEPTRHIVDVPRLLKWVKEDGKYADQQPRKEKLRKLLSRPVP
jgi:hypothetical protein